MVLSCMQKSLWIILVIIEFSFPVTHHFFMPTMIVLWASHRGRDVKYNVLSRDFYWCNLVQTCSQLGSLLSALYLFQMSPACPWAYVS